MAQGHMSSCHFQEVMALGVTCESDTLSSSPGRVTPSSVTLGHCLFSEPGGVSFLCLL